MALGWPQTFSMSLHLQADFPFVVARDKCSYFCDVVKSPNDSS
jgi:hypothetical protein